MLSDTPSWLVSVTDWPFKAAEAAVQDSTAASADQELFTNVSQNSVWFGLVQRCPNPDFT